MRLIDVDDFITKTRELYNQAGWGFRDVHYSQSDIEFNLSMMPTIDPVRHGRWIDLPGGNVYCTECGEQFDYRANYCPECGAKMDGEPKNTWKKLECGGYECSECGHVVDAMTKFCPECGNDKRWEEK